MSSEQSGGEAATLSPAQNKEIVRRYLDEVWVNRRMDRTSEYVAEDVVFHDLVRQGFPPGLAAVEESIHRFEAAFPRFSFEVHDLIADGDRVAFRYTSAGVNTGEFQGFPPTHREASMDGLVMIRMEDGLIAEGWMELDQMGSAQALGLMPKGAPPRAIAWLMVARIRLRDRLARRRSSS